jgi:hypothetical protein
METLQNLREENIQLKRALAFCINKPLVKRLAEALERINKGEYLSEEEFFKDSPQEDD